MSSTDNSSRPTPETEPGPLHRLLGLHQGDLAIVLPAILCGFCLFTGYSVAKPLRDAVGASLGTTAVAQLQTGTFFAMIGASAIVGLLVSRLSWKNFVLVANATWVLGAATIAGFFAWAGPDKSLVVDGAFFIAVSVFNLLSLSIFWATLSDIFDAERAKRAFPSIGLGLTFGNIAGSSFVAAFAKTIPYAAFLGVSCGMLVIAALCTVWILRYSPARALVKRRTPGGSIVEMIEGMRTAFSSSYLLRLSAYLFLYSVTGTLVYMLQIKILNTTFTNPDKAITKGEIAAVTSRIDLYANILTASLQLFVAGRILRWMGIGLALTLTPLTTLGAIGLLIYSPTVAMLVPVQVARRGMHYSLDRPAREVLFTVVSVIERYKSKSFIDTFIYRFGDVIGGWTQQLLERVGPAPGAVGASVLCVLFAGLGISLGKSLLDRERRAREKDISRICPVCEYDQTGLASDAPCPECNTDARKQESLRRDLMPNRPAASL
ncbi:MAG: NTP/NDP exchange transporter [Phycisphaerales bacterium]